MELIVFFSMIAAVLSIVMVYVNRSSNREVAAAQAWLDEEKKKPKYVIEVETEIETLESNPFEPHAGMVKLTSRGNALYETTRRRDFLQIQIGNNWHVIPTSRIISMKVRPEFDDE